MWVKVTQRMPPQGKRVFVRGDYVPPGTGFPIASREWRRDWNRGRPYWSSNEWRGMVAVREWWDDEAQQTEKGVEI